MAESGRKKTDSYRSATRGIFKIEMKLHEEHSQNMAAYGKELEIWEAAAKTERGPKPDAPVEPRLATDDFTPEVLCDILQVEQQGAAALG